MDLDVLPSQMRQESSSVDGTRCTRDADHQALGRTGQTKSLRENHTDEMVSRNTVQPSPWRVLQRM